jgi:hypothetical protein
LALKTLDVVMLLPSELERQAIESSGRLALEMAAGGHPSAVQLGRRRPGVDTREGICKPHVSLYMIAVEEEEVPEVVDAVRRVAARARPIEARGGWYENNGQGAPEVFFAPAPAWTLLQTAVLESVGPLRRGRLRAEDPNGESAAEIIERGRDPERVRLLRRYGYDEIGDRFRPHVTLAWPADRSTRVSTKSLSPAAVFSGRLSRIAVYEMRSHGTCTEKRAEFSLGLERNTGGVPSRRMGAAGPIEELGR